jgi:hypothetical protein
MHAATRTVQDKAHALNQYYGQPASFSGVTIASFNTKVGGAVAIHTINDAASCGGSASLIG